VSYIVDRRQNSKKKSAVNRQRFLRRYRERIKRAVADAVSDRSISDIESGEKIGIPARDIDEPAFGHGRGGKHTHIFPGNKEFTPGDRIKRPQQGEGGGGSQASDSGEGMDEFVFQISQHEFLDFMFEDLALPNLVKRQLVGDELFKKVRAGFSNVGNPSQINIVRSLRSAHARRIALAGGKRRKIAQLREQIAQLPDPPDDISRQRGINLEAEIEALKRRINAIPFIDDFDLKYNLHVNQPVPTTKAVMFCLMDVSGSMDEETKGIAKRFFILLYLFLQRNYRRTEVVFIRHHASAKEVDEQEFFSSRETGGTIVSSALSLMNEIVEERYPSNEWNIYAAQASDGDNWGGDSETCYRLLSERLLPLLQYYCYIEITQRPHQEMWEQYQRLSEAHADSFAMQHIKDRSDIYPVFRELFKLETQ
jgi:uncharacterized sporulation protein YeaH/YhbH (DUF444 family)